MNSTRDSFRHSTTRLARRGDREDPSRGPALLANGELTDFEDGFTFTVEGEDPYVYRDES